VSHEVIVSDIELIAYGVPFVRIVFVVGVIDFRTV